MVKISVLFPLGMQFGKNYDCFSKALIFIYHVNAGGEGCVRERERDGSSGHFKGQIVPTVKSFFVKQNS